MNTLTTDKPVRVQLRRIKGWRMPPNTINAARPGPLGNPYVHDDPAVAVLAFREMLTGRPTPMPEVSLAFGALPIDHQRASEFLLRVRAARGKNIACWCPLDQPCHADVILEIANQD